ncbi:TPA: hypothetical protein ACXAX7_003462 [Acinetobacter baumannii]
MLILRTTYHEFKELLAPSLSRGWVYNSKDFGPEVYMDEDAAGWWPFADTFWKPKSPRQDLVRAAALLIAEIERLDREVKAESKE